MTDQNKRFAELAGILWHEIVEHYYDGDHYYSNGWNRCSCGTSYPFPNRCSKVNPDFSRAEEVLKVMMERVDWPVFIERVGSYEYESEAWITVDYITTPGKLRDAAIDWMEGRKG